MTNKKPRNRTMAKRRNHRVPKNITERRDGDVMELIFEKHIMRELDRIMGR